jgi:hypothetical protein
MQPPRKRRRPDDECIGSPSKRAKQAERLRAWRAKKAAEQQQQLQQESARHAPQLQAANFATAMLVATPAGYVPQLVLQPGQWQLQVAVQQWQQAALLGAMGMQGSTANLAGQAAQQQLHGSAALQQQWRAMQLARSAAQQQQQQPEQHLQDSERQQQQQQEDLHSSRDEAADLVDGMALLADAACLVSCVMDALLLMMSQHQLSMVSLVTRSSLPPMHPLVPPMHPLVTRSSLPPNSKQQCSCHSML